MKQTFPSPGPPLLPVFGLTLVDRGQEKREGEGKGGRVRVQRGGRH